MYILGISEIDNDSGVTLLKDSEVVCAINEERLSRIKRHQGFPHLSVKWALDQAGISLTDVDRIAIAKTSPTVNQGLFYRVRDELKHYDYFDSEDPVSFVEKFLNLILHRFRNTPRSLKLAQKMDAEILDWINEHGLEERVKRVPHHYSHAACAYWASGYEQSLVVTMDGQGEGVTSQIYLVTDGEFEKLKETRVPHSMGVFYSAVTKALGFQPAKHEGKVTGLAAYATADDALLTEIRKLARATEDGDFKAPSVYGSYYKIKRLLKKYGREQMSSAFQLVLEEVVSGYIGHYVTETGCSNVALAGGVFANVKLNQRIHEIDGVENIFVFPHMGDGGLGYGAAQIIYRAASKDRAKAPIDNVYWGPEYSDDEIEQALKEANLAYQKPENIEAAIAEQLAQKKVVAHFAGRMEFGPRALGNRSILYPTVDPAVNDWLNDRLERSEFMPFAPVTLAEKASECYLGLEGAEHSCTFMTVTLDCTQWMKDSSPAVVHVDGTARPQLVSESGNRRYYQILKEYFELTGIPSLVNTSFNMHEEPIVCNPNDAIRAYVLGHLDVLAIGGCLVVSES